MYENYYFLFDKKDYQKFNLFLTLSNAGSYEINKEELFNLQTFSIKTTVINFNELKSDLTTIFGCEIIKQSGIESRLIKVKETNFNMKSLLLIYYVKRSYMFNLINLTVLNTGITPRELEGKLCVSKSKLYKIRKSLNSLINEAPFTFSLSGFEGDERSIRHFLVSMYWDIFGGFEWPFSENRESLIDVLNTFYFEGKFLSNMEIEISLYWLAITNMRINAGHIINSENTCGRYSTKDYPENDFFQREETFFSEENRFLIDTIKVLFNFSIDNNLVRNEHLIGVKKIEGIILHKAKEREASSFVMECLQRALNEIRYYIQEDMMWMYGFLNPQLYDNEILNFRLIIESDSLVDSLQKEIINGYYLLLKKFGIIFDKPLKVFIESKENKCFELANLISNNVNFPIEYHSVNSKKIDVVITNYGSEICHINKRTLFCEWPLTEMSIKILSNNLLEIK